jgi:CheY-like chemotaxis protein
MEATALIRAHERQHGGHLPIIAMTAHAMKGDREICLDGGMDGYVSKPIRAARLFDAIDEMVRDTPPPAGLQAGVTVDWSKARQVVQGDEDLLGVIVATFLEEYPRMLAELAEAVDRQHAKEIQRLAHLIKGSMRYLGARKAFDRADELEGMGRESRLDESAQALERLRAEIASIQPELSAFIARNQPSTTGAVHEN